tara:strand:- start:57 stop:728 length:672 start_codon:yes stop_codon:yes gene_type:complete
MGFINNTSYILNAVLTKKGREYLAKNDSRFNITKFALADDEVDYTLWNTAHPLGTSHYGAVLESMPLVEPVVDPDVVMKYKLITAPVGSKALAVIKNVTPLSVELLYTIDADGSANPEDVDMTGITTGGLQNVYNDENYKFLILNSNIANITAIPPGDEVSSSEGSYVETGRITKQVISREIKVTAKPIGPNPGELKTSLIITGQKSGAIFVVPITVTFIREG